MSPRKKAETATESATADPQKKMSPLRAAQLVLDKTLKKTNAGAFVSTDESKLQQSLPHLPTGSIVVDNLIGGRINPYGVMPCPGLPRGRLVNLYGKESSGKTTLALTASAVTTQRGGSVCYIDWENAIDLAYAKSIGVPIGDNDKFMLSQPETLEEGIKVLWMMARAGVDLIVVDSVSAGVPEAVFNQPLAEKGGGGRVGEVAAIWSRFLPQLKAVIVKTGTCVIGISQLRKTINKTGYGPDSTTAGGEAWKFYSELRMMLNRVKTEKGMAYDSRLHRKVETAVGNVVKVRIDKCKVSASQGLEDEIYIRFGDGIDDVRSVIDTAVAHGVVKKGGAWLSCERPDGTSLRGCGMEAFRDALKAAPGAWEDVYQATLRSMTGASLASLEGVALEPEDEDEMSIQDIDAILTGKSNAPEESEEASDDID